MQVKNRPRIIKRFVLINDVPAGPPRMLCRAASRNKILPHPVTAPILFKQNEEISGAQLQRSRPGDKHGLRG